MGFRFRSTDAGSRPSKLAASEPALGTRLSGFLIASSDLGVWRPKPESSPPKSGTPASNLRTRASEFRTGLSRVRTRTSTLGAWEPECPSSELDRRSAQLRRRSAELHAPSSELHRPSPTPQPSPSITWRATNAARHTPSDHQSTNHTCEKPSQVHSQPTLLNQHLRLWCQRCKCVRHDSFTRIAARAGSEAAS